MLKKLINFSTQQIKKLEKLCQDTGLSMSEHIRRALDEYLKKEQLK